MPFRIIPSKCPRCGRASNEWSIEREPGHDHGIAGCRCGEVFRVAVANEEQAAGLTSETPKKPIGWTEDGRADAWSATLRPKTITGHYGTDVVLPMVIGLFVSTLTKHTLVTVLVAMVVGSLAERLRTFLETRKRTSLFAFGNGRFRVVGNGKHDDVALEEIVRFSVETPSRGINSWRRPPFELAVHCLSRPQLRIPLFVGDVHEAQFVTDRANELLSTGGRIVDHGYRGERHRIALEEFAGSKAATDRAASAVLDLNAMEASGYRAQRRRVR